MKSLLHPYTLSASRPDAVVAILTAGFVDIFSIRLYSGHVTSRECWIVSNLFLLEILYRTWTEWPQLTITTSFTQQKRLGGHLKDLDMPMALHEVSRTRAA